MDLELEISNIKKNQYATGTFSLYFMQDKDPNYTAWQYGTGLPAEFDGLQIKIRENTRRVPKSPINPNSPTGRGHSIEARIVKDGKIVNQENTSQCSYAFTNTLLRVESDN